AGCTANTSTTLTAPLCCGIILQAAINHPTCAQNDGAIDISVSPTGTYTYSWDSGLPATANQLSLTAGTYSVTVTNENGCTASETVVLNPPTTFDVMVSTVEPSCGTADGSISVTVTPAGNYIYAWDNSLPAQANQPSLAAGQYSVTVTNADDLNCVNDTVIILSNSNAPTITFTNPINPVCAGGNDGAVTVNIAGGTAPYQVTIDTGGVPQTITVPVPITQTISSLSAGNVSVTITDAAGCSGLGS